MSVAMRLVALAAVAALSLAPVVDAGCSREEREKARRDLMDCFHRVRQAGLRGQVKRAAEESCKALFVIEDDCAGIFSNPETEAELAAEEGQEQNYAECLLSRGSNCQPPPREERPGQERPNNAENEERRDLHRGLPPAVTEKLRECIEDEAKTAEVCRQEIQSELVQAFPDMSDNRRTEDELRRAGEHRVGQLIRDCVANKTTEEEKRMCRHDSSIEEELRKITGRANIRRGELGRLARHQGADRLRHWLRKCHVEVWANHSECENGTEITDPEAREKCTNTSSMAEIREALKMCKKHDRMDDLRRIIAEHEGWLNISDIRDSMVEAWQREGRRRDLLLTARGCDKSDEGKRDQCGQELRDAFEAARGDRGGSMNISDNVLKRDIRRAVGSELGARMRSCADAGESGQSCVNALANAVVREGRFDSDGDVPNWRGHAALKDAGKQAAKEHARTCEDVTSQACRDEVKAGYAASIGKRSQDVTDAEVGIARKRAALSAAAEAIEACWEAKQLDPSATCADFMEEYMQVAGETASTNMAARQVGMQKLKRDILKEVGKEARQLCLENAEGNTTQASRANVAQCFQDLKDVEEAVLQELGLFSGESQQQRERKVSQIMKHAAEEAVYELFEACLIAAGTDVEQQEICKTRGEQAASDADLSETHSSIIHKMRGEVMEMVAESCTSDAKTCRDQAKDMLRTVGTATRMLNSISRVAGMKAAAEEMASCLEAGQDATYCDTAAGTIYNSVTGRDLQASQLAKVLVLAQAIAEGDPVVLERLDQIDVEALLDATECDDNATQAAFESMLTSYVEGNTLRPKIKFWTCLVVDLRAEYRATVGTGAGTPTEAEIEAFAKSLAEWLVQQTFGSRRLLRGDDGRALAAVVTGSAAQSVELCESGDQACGTSDPDLQGANPNAVTTTGSSTTAVPGTSGASSRWSMPALAVFAVWLLASRGV